MDDAKNPLYTGRVYHCLLMNETSEPTVMRFITHQTSGGRVLLRGGARRRQIDCGTFCGGPIRKLVCLSLRYS